jgi:cell division protein FtsQ
VTITLDPPVDLLQSLVDDPLDSGKRLTFAELWARAESGRPPEPLVRRRPPAPPRVPGRVGAVLSTPAVLDRVAPEPTVPSSVPRSSTSGGSVSNASGRRWFVDDPTALDRRTGEAVDIEPHPIAALLVSPEFERRRAAVEAELRRRARQPLMWALLALTLVTLGVLWMLSPWMSVRTIDVVGVDQPTAEAVRAAAGPLLRRPMVRVDPAEVVRKLQARPDIAAARVSKDWPNRIVIETAFRRPMATLRQAGEPDRVIDETGAVMSERAGVGLVLPAITVASGAGQSVDGLRDATTIVRTLGPNLRLRLARLDQVGMEFTGIFGSTSVRFGRADDLPAKAAALQALADAGQLERVAAVDVSVPDTAIVTARAKNS